MMVMQHQQQRCTRGQMCKQIVAMLIVEREGLDVIVGCKVCGKVHAVEPNHPQLPLVAIVRMRGSRSCRHARAISAAPHLLLWIQL